MKKMSISDLKNKLSSLAYKVTQKNGTEPAFSGQYNDFFEEGLYLCICCGLKLFSSKHKFKSRSGWPSFYKPISSGSINLSNDNSYNMSRVEVSCKSCNSHLGHVFDDGPEPTFKRYCINSVSIKFVENE